MTEKFVQVLADVECQWEGLNPIYRLYVNDELFAERTWRWTDCYLEEIVPIFAQPGEYTLRWELVPPHLAELTVKNLRIDRGDATVERNNRIRIHECELVNLL
jgi:hypothetical protein